MGAGLISDLIILANSASRTINRKKVLPLRASFYAGMAKLVDVPDLGSGAARHGGSSPSTRT